MTEASDPTEVRGYVADGFEKVAEVLADTATKAGEMGVGVHITIEGETVVDLSWGDTEKGPWASDDLVCVYSCTKGITALVAQMLVSRGLLDVEAPVATYWPEYAVNGKEDTLVKYFLNHSAGVLTFPRYWELIGPDSLGIADFDLMTKKIAEAPPSWVPGAGAGYHALTYGWLVGELVRRIDGRTVGRFFAEEVAGPMGIDAYLGLPEALHHRAVQTYAPLPILDDEAQAIAQAALKTGQQHLLAGNMEAMEALMVGSLFVSPEHPDISAFLPEVMNNPIIRSCELPAGNAFASAKGLAGAYTALANGGTVPNGPTLVSQESIDLFTTPTSTTTGLPTGYGLGFGLLLEGFGGEGVPGTAFGHGGAGGNMGLADPTRRLSYAYVKNRMIYDGEAAMAPLRALYTCL
jgi:CubicO group peptidase (beta-lactamase class C family)